MPGGPCLECKGTFEDVREGAEAHGVVFVIKLIKLFNQINDIQVGK